MARKLSAARGLDRREREFVRILVSTMEQDGSVDLSGSFRKAYGVPKEDGELVFPELDVEDMTAVHRRRTMEESRVLNPAQIHTKATATFKRKAVQRYFEEITGLSTVQYAQLVMEDQLLTSEGKEARTTAQKILEERDKVQRRQLIEEYWAITGEIGGDVIVPLPGKVTRTVMCPCGCKHEMEVSIPISARFPGEADVPTREAPEGHIRVTVADLKARRAHLHLSPDAKVALAHMAGAPWSEVDPDAKLSALQIESLSRPERTKICHGGSGVGKSVSGGLEAAIDTWIPGNVVAVLGQSYENVSPEFEYVDRFYRKIFGGDESMFIRIANVNRPTQHDFDIQPIWGSTCRGYSLDHNEGAVALGKSMDTVVIGEGAFVSTETMNTKIRRALDRSLMLRPGFEPRETGKLTIFTTPNNVDGCAADIVKGAERLTRKQLWKLSYACVGYQRSLWFREATVLDNPSYDPAIYEARRIEMESQGRLDEFRMVYEGKMTHKSGLVLRHFDQDRHVIPMPSIEHRRQMRFAIGMDTGTFKANMLVGIDRDRILYWLGECKTERLSLSEHNAQAQEMMLERMPYAFPGVLEMMDRIDLHVVDPASQQKLDIEEIWPGFHVDHPTRNEGAFELDPTVDQINSLFMQDRLLVVEDCVYTIDELLNYRFKNKKSSVNRGAYFAHEIARENDHLLDAGRYATIPLDLEGPLEVEPSQMTLKEVYERDEKREIFGTLTDALQSAEDAGGIWIGGAS